MGSLPFIHPAGLSTQTPDVQRFFDELCPQLLRRNKHACRAVGGRLKFNVLGSGVWTLDLETARVVVGSMGGPCTVVNISSADMGAWLGGRLDFRKALREGSLSVEGTVDKFAVVFAVSSKED